ncbi:hypothetical protein SDC9_85222 [bioreactor metagenome]|uniref:Uncharacterized protein n=1 Tax=bioreactor metagenome TaxID=1076179 RepID=A0A644ZIR7_9ZZZZ
MGKSLFRPVSWGTYPATDRSSPGFFPKTETVPESGTSSPRASFSSVVLPPPLGPMIIRNSPCGTEKVTSRRTESVPKEKFTPLNERAFFISDMTSRFLPLCFPRVPAHLAPVLSSSDRCRKCTPLRTRLKGLKMR